MIKLTHLLNLLLALVLLLASAPTSHTIQAPPGTDVVFFPQTEKTAQDNWQTECVDCPRRFEHMTDRSLRLDHAGRPHIVYGGDHLYYAWHDGLQWHDETVDQAPGVGSNASLALDASGRPHISFYDSVNDDLKYAHHDATAWQIETVDSEGYVGANTSLALDRMGRPYIVYFDAQNNVKYASPSPRTNAREPDAMIWQVETLDNVGSEGVHSASLALDGLGLPHVSFYDGHGYDLKYAWYDGIAWRHETVDSAGLVGTDSSLAVDVAGRAHISYSDWGNSDLKYAHFDGTAWQIETIDSEGYVGGSTSLALDPSGRPYVSYFDWGNRDLKVAWYDGIVWRDMTVDSEGDVGTHTSLAITCLGGQCQGDGLGLAHISYFDATNDSLKYARHNGLGWQIETVDSAREVGAYTSLALDGLGHPHVSYCMHSPHASTCEELEYARYDGTAWWAETVDDAGLVGAYNSLALDGAGRPHISYYDSANGDLKYAWRDETGWQVETVDSTGNVGQHASLALDGLGQPHVRYFDGYPNYDLKYTWRDGATWRIITVDSAGDVGRYTSLALDEWGHSHISYFDNTNDDLKYAQGGGTVWQVQTVDSAGHVGTHASLALDNADWPHISYFDGYPNCDIEVASLTPPAGTGSLGGTAWRTETVPLGNDCAESYLGRSALALDVLGRPHLSFCLYETDTLFACHDLQYAWRDSKGWHVETLPTDNALMVGPHTSLALDESGRARVSYQDSTNGDLKVAQRTLPLLDLDKQVTPTSDLHNNDTLTYTLTLFGPGLDVTLWDPLPPGVHYVSSSLGGSLTLPPVYSPTLHAITWQGTLPTDTVQVIRFQVTPAVDGTGSLSLALPIVNTAWLTDTASGASVLDRVIVNGWRVHLPLMSRND